MREKSHLWSAVSSSSAASHPTPPEFGRGLLKYWSFDEGYVNLNHGQSTFDLVLVLVALTDW